MTAGDIVGTVSDSSGAAVPNAKVTAKMVASDCKKTLLVQPGKKFLLQGNHIRGGSKL
jgi:hypothetical protein